MKLLLKSSQRIKLETVFGQIGELKHIIDFILMSLEVLMLIFCYDNIVKLSPSLANVVCIGTVFVDRHKFLLFSLHSHEILFSRVLNFGDMPSLCLRHDVDALLWETTLLNNQSSSIT